MNRKSITYNSWAGMRQRCLNKDHHAYTRYGGRGIKKGYNYLYPIVSEAVNSGDQQRR
jgi:hypothetical protein